MLDKRYLLGYKLVVHSDRKSTKTNPFGGFMKTIAKKITLAGLGAACVLSLSLSAGMLAGGKGVAKAEDSAAPDAKHFFYDNLLDTENKEYTLAKRFYEVLDKLNKEEDFKDGVVDYNISDIVTSAQLKAWIEDGNLEVPRAFAAARDAFLTDHPEIFYINFYKLTISVGKSGGNYVGYLNSGREANLFYDNGFNTSASVETAITAYNAKVNEIVDLVTKKENDNNEYVARDVYLAKEVNIYLAENIEYDYAAYDNKDDANYVAEAYINTPYGGLIEGKAVCGGFSTSYKVIMDALGIPCITVNGYSNNKNEYGFNSSASVYHMWNYVWLENPADESTQTFAASRAASNGAWYSMDVTWNSSSYSRTKYAVMSSGFDAELHVTDGVISSSGYKLRYPELSPITYGSTDKTDGLQVSLTYEQTGEKDDFQHDLVDTYITVSYNGKSAKKLFEEDGLYLAKRESYYAPDENGIMQIKWTNWNVIEYWRRVLVEYNGGSDFDEFLQDTGTQTRYYDNSSVYGIQIAIFDVKPDRATPDDYTGNDPTLGKDPEKDPYFFYYYSNALMNEINAVAISDVKTNESYGTYTPAPYVNFEAFPDFNVSLTISDAMRDNKNNSKMNPNSAFVLKVKYDQPLHILDETQPIGISFTSIRPNAQEYAFFVPYKDGTYVKLIDECTVEFKFCPSLMYEHNDMSYNFFFSNLGSARKVMRKQPDGTFKEETLNKAPNSVNFGFSRAYLACPARFNYDGRLWVDCCAQPELVSNSDLSEDNFKDENGNSLFSEAERSQMMLVAERADTETVDSILDGIGGIEGSNVSKSDVKSSETYDIYLQMCGKYPKIPDGSYVKIALGFPEGYGPKDEGVTFKLYHRKHIQGDEYIIEEVPCVVTQFGIVACVTSFSPYMVAVVDADKVTDKITYASIEGKGGTLTNEDGRIISFKKGDTHTYTIKPDKGYLIYSVTLNGVNVLDRVVNGKLTLGYDDLDMNNQLVIQYISTEAASRIQQKLNNNLIDQAIEVGKHVVGTDGNVEANATLPGFDVHPDNFVDVINGGGQTENKPNVALIAVAVVLGVLALVTVTGVVVVLVRRKNR